MAVAPRAVRVGEPFERSAGREVETNPRGLLRRLPSRHVANVARCNLESGNLVA
jgi:hypothetical protein